MNERGQEIGNPSITAERELPWLQDLDSDGDGNSDNWLGSWDYAYRDVVIVDVNNHAIDVLNLTSNNLASEETRAELTQKLIAAAESSVPDTWTNPADSLDVNDDTVVTPLDALLVLNELNTVGPHELGTRGVEDIYYLDVSGDGFVSPLDALLVLNRLNEPSSAAAVAATVPSVGLSLPIPESGSPQPSTHPSASLLAAAIDAALSEDGDELLSKRSLLTLGG